MTQITGGSDKKRHKKRMPGRASFARCGARGEELLLRAFRVLNERAVRVDDVAVVVRGRAADDGAFRFAVFAVGLDHVALRRDGVPPGRGETVLEGVVPAVVLR